jgi:hypothetical protein
MINKENLNIIRNLDTKKVTWSQSYIQAAKNLGIYTSSRIDNKFQRQLFLGDNIPEISNTYNNLNLYFLAASTLPVSDSPKQSDIEKEFKNINQTNYTFVVSQSELKKILNVYPNLSEKIKVAGFPVALSQLANQYQNTKKSKRVCFLGETREIKNIEFEIQLIEKLKKFGFECIHSSPNVISRQKELNKAGCLTYENMRGTQYFQLIKSSQYYISTSFYESLGVSGIEAALLNCITVVPQHTGQAEWCPAQQTYKHYEFSEIFEILQTHTSPNPNPKLEWYRPNLYFERVINSTPINNEY